MPGRIGGVKRRSELRVEALESWWDYGESGPVHPLDLDDGPASMVSEIERVNGADGVRTRASSVRPPFLGQAVWLSEPPLPV